MVSSGIFLIFSIMLRILMGHLAQKFVALSAWLKWFNIICIAMAAVLGLQILLAFINSIVRMAGDSRTNKQLKLLNQQRKLEYKRQAQQNREQEKRQKEQLKQLKKARAK